MTLKVQGQVGGDPGAAPALFCTPAPCLLVQGPGRRQPGMNLERHPMKVGHADGELALEPLLADLEAD